MKKNNEIYNYNGKYGYFSGTLKDFSIKFNIKLSIIQERLRSRWEFNRIIDTPVKDKPKTYSYKEDKDQTVGFYSKKYNIPLNDLKKRLSKGFSIKDAIEIPYNHRKTYIINGKKFKTYQEIGEFYGISKNTIQTRLRRGENIEQIVNNINKIEKFSFNYKGNYYKDQSKNDIAKILNVPAGRIYNLFNEGYTIDEIIEKEAKIKIINSELITVFKGTDREFSGYSNTEIARHFNIKSSTLSFRMEKGMTLEEAIDYEYTPPSGIHTVFKGTDREFSGSIMSIEKHFGFSAGTLNQRIKRNNISIEEAIDWERKDSFGKSLKKYTVFEGMDKEFKGTIKEIAKQFDIKQSLLQSRLQKGMTLEEAITIKYYTYTVFKGTSKEFIGTRKQIAEHFGISLRTLKARISEGYSLEEAIEFNNKNYITVFEGTYKEFTGYRTQIAEYFGININNFKRRIEREGYTPEEAIEIPMKQVTTKGLSYKGHKGEMRELCKQFNKNYIEVYNKVKYNHTFEWAMDSTNKPYEE